MKLLNFACWAAGLLLNDVWEKPKPVESKMVIKVVVKFFMGIV